MEVEVSNHSETVAVGVVPSHVDFHDKPITKGDCNPGGTAVDYVHTLLTILEILVKFEQWWRKL